MANHSFMIESMRVDIQTVPLSHEAVAELLARATDTGLHCPPKIDLEHSIGKKHLRAHRDRDGFFVRQGAKGRSKIRLADKCKVTSFNGEPTLFRFYLEGY